MLAVQTGNVTLAAPAVAVKLEGASRGVTVVME